MEAVGQRLNLRGHLSGHTAPSKIPIFSPGTPLGCIGLHISSDSVDIVLSSSLGDIEGHKGLDGRYYVLDFARTFPPEGRLTGDPSEQVPSLSLPSFALYFLIWI